MRLLSSLALTAAVAATAVAQPNPASPVPVPNPYPTPLYRTGDVARTLNLNQNQINRLNSLTEQTQAQYRSDYTKAAGLAEADRMVRMAELNRQYSAAWGKGAADVFNDTQAARYRQLNYQYGGFHALYDPDVQKRLNLTPDQVRNLREQADWSNRQWQEVNRAGVADVNRSTQLYKDYWNQRQERFNRYLTPEQQRAWATMVGDPYTFPPNFTP